MKYIVPSSKIVFTDLMILLVSVLIGLNSTMTFNDERDLPPVDLPEISDDNRETGSSDLSSVVITIETVRDTKQFFYENQKVTRELLFEMIQNSKISSVILRGDKKTNLSWEEVVSLNSELSNSGVKTIRYSIKRQ